jgi:uncharacterized membrane protein YhaH (DUF805 family)
MNGYLTALKKYAVFSGRARRSEYWGFVLINFIIGVVLSVIRLAANSDALVYVLLVYELAVLIPALAVAVRRLHDSGRSGGWIFISLIPFIGPIWLLVLLLLDGTIGPNDHGPNPRINP